MIKKMPPWLKDLLRPVKRAGLCLRGLDFFCRPDVRLKLEHHGSDYGGWSVVENSLGPEAVVFSFGLGHDLSFDESISGKYGCSVIGYDPDPRAWNYHIGRELPPRLQWIRKGIGSSDTKVTFYPPKRDDYISGTIVANRPGHSSDGIEIELLDVAGVTAEAAERGRIDVLKMDIEGAEYAVIRRLIETGRLAKIDQLLVEFHHGDGVIKIGESQAMIKLLRSNGHRLAFVSKMRLPRFSGHRRSRTE